MKSGSFIGALLKFIVVLPALSARRSAPSLKIDEYSAWTGEFYFSKGKLIDHVTRGHGKSESDDWDPEKEILQRLEKRKKELASLK